MKDFLSFLCYVALAVIFSYFVIQVAEKVAANTAIQIMNDPPMYMPWLNEKVIYEI